MSIKKIAKITGFSTATVNLCLNKGKNSDRISEATKQKILSVAKELNYVKNAYASGLSSKKSPFIGLILPTLDNRFFGILGGVFEEYAKNMNLIPIITVTKYDYELEKKAVESFIQNKISAIFLGAVSQPDKLSKLCNKYSIFNVCFDNIKQEGISFTSNNEDSCYLLTKHLINNNNSTKPIIFVGGTDKYYTQRERLKGFIRAHEEYGLTMDHNKQIITCDYNQDSTFQVMNQLIENNELQVGGICFNSLVVFEGGMLALIQNKIERNFVLGCFDFHPFLRISNIPLTAIQQNPQEMMKQAFVHFKNENFTKDQTIIKIQTEIITIE